MKILIGTPTYDRRIDIDMVRAFINLERNNNHSFDYVFPVSSHISRNRNYCIHEFLKTDNEWLLFLDSDIGILDPTFVDKMLETGYKFGAQVICGAYTKKQQPAQYVLGIKDGSDLEKYKNLESLKTPMEIDAGGTGIMLIKREVLEKMKEPWFTIIDGENLFVMPEDFEFCRKAQELGFKIAADPRFSTTHWGNFAYKHEV